MSMKRLFLALIVLSPFAIHASAVRECKVNATITRIMRDGKSPSLRSMRLVPRSNADIAWEDCSELLMFEGNHVVELKDLSSPFKLQVGAPIILLFVEVRGVTKDGPQMSRHWEVYPENPKSSCDENAYMVTRPKVRILERF